MRKKIILCFAVLLANLFLAAEAQTDSYEKQNILNNESFRKASFQVNQLHNRILKSSQKEVKSADAELANEAEQVVKVDKATLLSHPELLERAMQSVVYHTNIAGIRKVLPIYYEWQGYSPLLANYAQGLLYFADKKFTDAIACFKFVINAEPDAQAVKFYLAIAYIYNRQYHEAQQALHQLAEQNMPDDMAKVVKQHQKDLEQYEKLQLAGSVSFIYDPNVNSAPDVRAIKTGSGSITFEEKKFAYGVNYQYSLNKKMVLPDGWYIAPQAGIWGNSYIKNKEYNDLLINTSISIGKAHYDYDYSVSPYFNKRFYGDHPYTNTVGVRANLYNRWNSVFASSLSFDYSRERYDKPNYQFYNNHELEGGASLIVQPNDSLTMITGFDVGKHYGTRDKEDSYHLNRYRFFVNKQFANGLGTRLSLSYTQRHYDGENWFTNGKNRLDKDMILNASIQHNKIQKWGIMPRFTVQIHKVNSNSILNAYHKNSAFVELVKEF